MSRVLPLSRLTSLGVGGEAVVEDVKSACEAVRVLSRGDCVVLGNGTNVLFPDRGLTETVVVSRLKTTVFDGERVYAESGVPLIGLCAASLERSLSGLEWACGIPGSVGGAVACNAGAFGSCAADFIEYADVYRGGEIRRLSASECGFKYRSGGFESDDFIVGACFKLERGDKAVALGRARCYRRIREASQPSGRTAGSTYKNADKPAGFYIEAAGLKGERVGGARVSEKHANFVLNDGTATASDVIKLLERIEKRVYEAFGVRLEREIRLIGDFD